MPVESDAPNLLPKLTRGYHSTLQASMPSRHWTGGSGTKIFSNTSCHRTPIFFLSILFYCLLFLPSFFFLCLPACHVRPTGGFEDTQPSAFPTQNRCLDLQASSKTICTGSKTTTFFPWKHFITHETPPSIIQFWQHFPLRPVSTSYLPYLHRPSSPCHRRSDC
jgi:hypothetical protein